MTDVVGPRTATPGTRSDDNELAALVRRWVGARRPGTLRVAPPPDGPGGRPEWLVPPEVPVQPARRSRGASAAPVPALPHRPTADEPAQATRLAVLIDARRISEEVATALLTRVADRGSVTVCRAYADWGRADLGSWVDRLRREGRHSFHQLADDDQALVALTIDAVDVAREASVDEVVIAGDMTSMLPLVHRLHAAGVRVVVVGPQHTPHDVRAACDEFLDAQSLVGEAVAPAGRHRA